MDLMFPTSDACRFSSLEIREGCGVHSCDAYTPPSAAAAHQRVNRDVLRRIREELNYLEDICTETEGTRI
jgi:hypothetical protein